MSASLTTSSAASTTNTRQTGTRQSQDAPTSFLTCLKELKLPSQKLGSFEYTSNSPCWQCIFSKDGAWLAACYGAPDPCVRIWKVTEERDSIEYQFELSTTLHLQDHTIRSVSFAPTTQVPVLASASFDGTVAIWEYSNTNKEWECMAQLEGHDNEVKCVRFNATGSLLATCGRDKSVWIWECFLPGTIGGPDQSNSVDGGGDFECLAVLNGHEGDVKCVEFAPSHGQWGDGDEILLSSSYDNSIKIWAEDAGDWYCASTLMNVHSSTIWSIAVSPGGSRLVSGSDDGSIGIFKCYTKQEKAERFPDTEPGSDGLWKCVGRLPDAHSSTIYSVHCAPARAGHGRIASSGADNRIQIYREAMGSTSDQPLFSLEAVANTQHGDVNCVCWHPWDGSVLASTGDDGTVRIWRYSI